jgi:putative protein-disulfide isomerase
MKSPPILWYFADPMCSWCWGFTPVLDQVKETFGDELKVALMMGGLRPGTTDPMTSESRDEILHHWHEVKKMTGQNFTFEGAMPDGFIYDTEPPSRAVIAMSEINLESTLPYFKKIQEAFYVGQEDVADTGVLEKLVSSFSIDSQEFTEKFNSDELKRKTQLHFQQTRQAEVRGFPTLVLNTGAEFEKISTGYRPYEAIKGEIDEWIKTHDKQPG